MRLILVWDLVALTSKKGQQHTARSERTRSQSNAASGSGEGQTSEMEELRREVQQLRQHNAQLTAVPPPAYSDNGRG
jgi:hypothetical protein